MFADTQKARRAAQDAIRKILSAPPKTVWRVDAENLEGVSFALASTFELAAVDRVCGGALRRGGIDAEGGFVRRAKVWAADGYVRTDAISGDGKTPAPCGLEHPKLGTVYLDVADRSFLHFSPEQLAAQSLPEAAEKIRPEWALADGKDTVTLSARGIVSLDIEIALAGEAPAAATISVLSACLPGLAQLSAIGLPLEKLAAYGMPRTVTVWQVDARGKRIARIATHAVAEIKIGPIIPDTFRIPKDFHDLRKQQPDKDAPWRPVYRGKLRPRRKAKGKSAARSAERAMMEWVPPAGIMEPPRVADEPPLPSCLPSTFQASCAYEIRQPLLDTIGYVINLFGERLTSVEGRRNGDDTDVTMTIDWLDQLQQFSDGLPQGDGLFCMMRDVPPDDDPTAGGGGLLNLFAESLARELLAADEPVPVGGDDPVTLPQEIVDEITQVAEDETTEPEDRFAALSAETQAAMREAVLTQRIGRINYVFDGDFGEHIWPSPEFAMLHVALQLERLAISFTGGKLMRKLAITVDNNGRPHIDFALALAGIDATVHMERRPGTWFWVVAPVALVVGGIATAAAVGMVITTLIGLGPFGLLILYAMISAAPLAALASVAGGLLLLGALTYLVWDVTNLRLQIDDAELTSSVAPDIATSPEEVVLDPDQATLDGTITVSVRSEIPSGIHQLFDWIVNGAVTQFDQQIRTYLEDMLVDGLEDAARSLPHFRLPLPRHVNIDVPITNIPQGSVSVSAPRHRLAAMAANGVEDSMLSASSRTRMEFPFAALRPYLTQVDLDSREKLTRLIEDLIAADKKPLFGYAISQNLLNAVAFSRWLDSRHALDYNEGRVAEAFETLIGACPECEAIADAREVHVWAAAPPQILVTPRAFLEDKRRPYLSVLFPDVRLCIGGIADKPSSLEVQFSITSVAHAAFGMANANGKGWSLFSVDRNFLHVLFDERGNFRRLSPVETQGLEFIGPGFEAVAAMDADKRLAFLQAIQPMLDAAARRLLQREDAAGMIFDDEHVSRQIYDQMLAVDFVPRRASIYATCAVTGPAALVMPARDANGDVTGLLEDLTCADGRALLPLFQ